MKDTHKFIIAIACGEERDIELGRGKRYTSIFLNIFLFTFRERWREGERQGEKHQCVVASLSRPTGDLAHNPGMCPDWESNQWPFGSQACAQSTELHQPGLYFNFIYHGLFLSWIKKKVWNKYDKTLTTINMGKYNSEILTRESTKSYCWWSHVHRCLHSFYCLSTKYCVFSNHSNYKKEFREGGAAA